MAKSRSTAKKVDSAWKAAVRIAHRRGLSLPDHEDQLDYRLLTTEEGLTEKEYNTLREAVYLTRTVLGAVPKLPPKKEGK